MHGKNGRVRTFGGDYAFDAGWPFAGRETQRMNARPIAQNVDLRAGPPRRWNTSVDGVVWLPRLIDKTRAYQAGMLGTYLYGQSPIDDSFLRRAALDYQTFSEIVRTTGGDDAAVLAAIEARAPGVTERLRAWGTKLAAKQQVFLAVLDLDDGIDCTGWRKVVRDVGNAVFPLVVAILRRRRPTPP